MGLIQKLPVTVVNQIAAGEVIERPASVVKELLENSLDAGATRLEVTVEQGGRDLIRIWDNGRGIAPDDIELALTSHATSKLHAVEDLTGVLTYGFRGEALASIASICHMNVQSCLAEAVEGTEIQVVGGETTLLTACGCPQGTTIECRNLFYNMPVRRRFLKAAGTEMSHITEVFTRIALAQLELAMRLKNNDRIVFDLPAGQPFAERAAAFFGDELSRNLIEFESVKNGQKLHGFVADPSMNRSNSRTQYIFINGRYIRDRSLSHAISEAFRGLLMVGRYPIGFLFFEVTPDEVDVNVHPMKIEVRFRDPNQFFSMILHGIREQFMKADLTARWDSQLGGSKPDLPDPDVLQQRAAINDSLPNASSKATPEFKLQSRSVEQTGRLPLSATPSQDRVEPRVLPFESLPPSSKSTDPGNHETDPQSVDDAPKLRPAGDESSGPINLQASSTLAPKVLQVHNTYLIMETAEGMLVIDQHALHERILYEKLRTRVLGDGLELQRLLVPETLEMSAAEVEWLTANREVLEQLGLQIEPFGGTTVALHTIPAILRRVGPGRILRDIMDDLASETHTPARRDLLDHLLHSMSCKAAIKAGQRLSDEEIRSLAEQRHLAQDAHHCPHGRPTALIFSIGDLERQFKRI